jgi:hypothetical protein
LYFGVFCTFSCRFTHMTFLDGSEFAFPVATPGSMQRSPSLISAANQPLRTFILWGRQTGALKQHRPFWRGQSGPSGDPANRWVPSAGVCVNDSIGRPCAAVPAQICAHTYNVITQRT